MFDLKAGSKGLLKGILGDVVKEASEEKCLYLFYRLVFEVHFQIKLNVFLNKNFKMSSENTWSVPAGVCVFLSVCVCKDIK